MKQYVIDELRPQDHQKIKSYLDEHLKPGPMEGLYWMPLEEKIFSEYQASHLQCQPFYIALELEPERLACELLIRTHNKIRCECMAYADENQRDWIIRSIDAIFEKLEISV